MSSQREILLKQLQRRGDANSGYDNFVKQETMTRDAILKQIQEQQKKDDIIIEQNFVPIDERRKELRSSRTARLSLSEIVEGINNDDPERVLTNAQRLKDLILKDELSPAVLDQITKTIGEVERIAKEAILPPAMLSKLQSIGTEIKNLSQSRKVSSSDIEVMLKSIDPDLIDRLFDEYSATPDASKEASIFAQVLKYISERIPDDLSRLSDRSMKKVLKQYIKEQQGSTQEAFVQRPSENQGSLRGDAVQIYNSVNKMVDSQSMDQLQDFLIENDIAFDERRLTEASPLATRKGYVSDLIQQHLKDQLPREFDTPNDAPVRLAREIETESTRRLLDDAKEELQDRVNTALVERAKELHTNYIRRIHFQKEVDRINRMLDNPLLEGRNAITTARNALERSIKFDQPIKIPSRLPKHMKEALRTTDISATDEANALLSRGNVLEEAVKDASLTQRQIRDLEKGIRKDFMARERDIPKSSRIPVTNFDAPVPPVMTPSQAVINVLRSRDASSDLSKLTFDDAVKKAVNEGLASFIYKGQYFDTAPLSFKSKLNPISYVPSAIFDPSAPASASASSSAPAPAPEPTLNTYTGKYLKIARGKAQADGVESFMWKGRKYITNVEASVKGKGAGQYNTTEHKKRLIREFLN